MTEPQGEQKPVFWNVEVDGYGGLLAIPHRTKYQVKTELAGAAIDHAIKHWRSHYERPIGYETLTVTVNRAGELLQPEVQLEA